MNPGVSTLSLPSAKGFLGGRMSGQRSRLLLGKGNYSGSRMYQKLANGMKLWKGDWNTTTLLFSLKVLEILIKKEEDN
jgi:hypothetical protein